MKKAVENQMKTAKKKVIDKDVAKSKKISSFFTKKSPESVSITNNVPVNNSKEENDSNNKRKINEFEGTDTLEHNAKFRKVEFNNAIGSTPGKIEEKSHSTSKNDWLKTQKTVSPAKDVLLQMSSVNKTHESTKDLHLNSDLASKTILKENVICDEDSGIVSKHSSVEETLNGKIFNEVLSKQCSLNDLNKENNLDNKQANDSNSKPILDNIADLHLSDFCDEVDNFFEENWDEAFSEENLDLSVLKRCVVLDVRKNGRDVVLILQDSNSEERASVRCCDYWVNAEVEKGQIVMIQASKINNEWIVNNSTGLLVTQPDMLISGTSVVGALFCNRRSVLKEKFRGFESLPHVESDATYMTVGLLVHNILQKTLELKVETLPEITQICEEVLETSYAISLLHQSKMSIQDCRIHIQPYLTQIYNFIQRYMKGNKVKITDNNFNGQIDTIRDIEENIWLPKLGLKGKIDVSVEVKINSRRKIMPLELKTGKSSFSPEHKGQVILYTMMMSMIGQQVDSGLLLYLKQNEMKEVSGSHHEQRDLLMLRNNLSHYLAKKSNVNVNNFDDIKEFLLDLPEPINHRNACTTCPVNHLCSMYLKYDDEFRRRDSSHPMKALSENILNHLKPEHINYVMRWVKLQQIEEEANNLNDSMKDMWTIEPLKREKKGTCISNLKVVHVEKMGDRYSHTFEKIEDSPSVIKDFTHSEINENDYVVINIENRINISSGFVTEMSYNSITILLERNIKVRYSGSVFHVDKYFSANLSNYNRAGVSGLLADNELCSRLRSIIIEKKPATFNHLLSRTIAPISAPILKRLNKQQQRAIFRILTAREYVLLKGMPGTGKTRTLVALVELLVKIGKSVLITANTHSAVDNILIGLVERNIDFLRLGSQAKVHPSLTNYSEFAATAECKTPESLEDVYRSKNVVGVTCFGAYHKLFESRKFDLCLVDESTQAQQCAVLKPLYNSEKFVLVGDPEQLPPIAKSETARKLGFNESLFARLDSENNTIVLFSQYRMNREIMTLANKITYKDQLQAGNETLANATLVVKNTEYLQSCNWWIQAALSVKLEDSVILLNTSIPKDMESKLENIDKGNKMYINQFEAAIVQVLVKTLLKIGLNNKDIGIMAPFRAQVSLLGKAVPKEVEVNTVDQYQGREKNIIIYSCTESAPQGSANTRAFHILNDHNRLTVAVTRAKQKLVIIGDKNILETYSPFEKLLRFMRKENMINLFDSQKSCDWKEIIDSFKSKSKVHMF